MKDRNLAKDIESFYQDLKDNKPMEITEVKIAKGKIFRKKKMMLPSEFMVRKAIKKKWA